MGKASKERRRLERMARMQGQELSSFSDLVNYGRDRATTAFQAAHRATVEPIQESIRQPFQSVASHFSEAKSMSTSRLKSLASTVFQGKGATAMSRSGKKWPVLGAMIIALTAVAGYWGYNRYSQSSGSNYSTPVYQYQAERHTAPQASPSSNTSIFSTSKIGEVLSLKKANPNVHKVSAHKTSAHGKRSGLHRKGHHAKHKKHKHGLAKHNSKSGIQKASHKKHGHHKGGQLKKKKHRHTQAS